jgi:(1->4)-alpha-D-glucan 1-alpha-D-glucosylmutase
VAEHALQANSSTYRLQLQPGFGFADAEPVVPYLARLGLSHLYLSPVLQAVPGSVHGYDVIDHSVVSADHGGLAGLESLAETCHRHGMGIVCDIVPNHMAIPAKAYLNRQVWSLLRDGQGGPTADWFDIDWDLCDGRVGLPILGSDLDDVLRRMELKLGRYKGGPVIRYGDYVLPVAPGTEGGSVGNVLARQHYVLAHWHDKASVLGYRRFFDVDTLIAIRVERPEVFDATHALLLDLHRRGVVDGFRVDHPDGLADPEGYLARLRAVTGGAWVVVEKILGGDEELPAAWPCDGTTGYDAIKVINQAFVPDDASALTQRWTELGGEADYHATELAAKHQILHELLTPELARLVRVARAAESSSNDPVTIDLCDNQLTAALSELLVQSDVYRAYLRPGHPAPAESVTRLESMRDRARAAEPDLAGAVDAVSEIVGSVRTNGNDAWSDLVVRFQQTTGPVMAKGVEDTAFYRWHRLIALNEVGGDPTVLDRPTPYPLYAWASHQQQHHPRGLTTLSTHDTKRSEDVRARLLALAGDLDSWDRVWTRVRHLAHHADVDEPTAYLDMQTMVGAWPIDGDRLAEYLRKAAREAKQHTTWTDPREPYESRLFGLAHAATTDPETMTAVKAALDASAAEIRALTLGTKLVQLTLPGVADSYQGTELVSLTLVDPDNRALVDYDEHARRLERLDAGRAPADLSDEKLRLVAAALRLRRRAVDAFGEHSTVAPLDSSSPYVIGFVRGGSVATIATRSARHLAARIEAETITLPPGEWHDVLSGVVHDGRESGMLAVRDVLAVSPVALLEKGDA